MSGGDGQTGSQAPAAPEAYTPGNYALRVFCDLGHPLTGLVVVWSMRPPRPPSDGRASSPEADVVKVADRHEPPPGRFAAGFVDKAGFLQPIFRGVNPWADVASDRRPQTYKLQAERKYHFILLRHPSATLARALADWLNAPAPDAPKPAFDFRPWGGEACFGGEGATPDKLVEELELTTAPPAGVKPAAGGGKELYLTVPETPGPERYWPKGHRLYARWTLYLDMPNAACTHVKEEIGRLQKHLGILRFPVGIQERPYWPDPPLDKGPPRNGIPGGNLGVFELRTAAALMRFQEHAAGGRAFKLTPEAFAEVNGKLLQDTSDPRKPAATYAGKETWACLLGREVGRAAPAPPGGAASSEGAAGGAGGAKGDGDGILPELEAKDLLVRHAWGVVDEATGNALELWLKKGYRKPGKILLAVNGTSPGNPVYLRQEAAVQLEGWRRLGMVFGVSYQRVPFGMPSGHSFRDISSIARGIAGMLNNSIHKTGLAVDLWIASTRNDADYTKPRPEWPIRMEQRFEDPSKDPAILARRQLATAEAEKEAATASRAADAKLAAGAPPAPPVPPGAPPSSPEQARSRSVIAHGKANAARERAKGALAKAGADPAKRAKAAELSATAVAHDDAHLAALAAEIDLVKRAVAAIEAEMAKTKLGYRMRFCLYGHSTLDVFGAPHDAAVALETGLDRLRDDLGEQLEARFPASLATQARAWIRDVAFADYLDPDRIRRRLPPTREGIVAGLFRCAIRPFLFDPLQPDGGKSWAEGLVAGPNVPCHRKPLRPAEQDIPLVVDRPGATPAELQPYSGQARSYVNLTALGHCCDMFGIGTAGTKWKQALATLEATKDFREIGAYVKAAAEHDEAKLQPVVFLRRKLPVAALLPEKLEIGFLLEWANALKELASVTVDGKTRASACCRPKAPRLVFRLPPPELASDGDRAVALLRGELAERRFVVVQAGKETGLAELPAAGALAGKDLGAKLEAATKAFQERVGAFRKAAEEKRKAVKGGTSKAAPAAPKQGPDPVKLDRTWFEVTIQPLFEKGVVPAAGLENVVLQPGDVAQIAAPGIPRTLEWWHFQSWFAIGDSWEKQVEEIGFSERILLAADPPEQDGGDWDGRGIGYTRTELESKDGGIVSLAPPSNEWRPPPAGW